VDHRANNLMSVVQGTVALSQANDVDALREVIIGRLHALAFAHQLLSQARWSGADLRRLVEEELLSFSLGDEGGSVRITGPSVALEPQAAQGVAMALHELTTNAAKYGALSSPTGRVEISWQVDAGDRLHLRWVESGGPTVDPPGRRGFGTSVIGRALGGAIGGQSRIDWRREGVVCELEFPLHTGASPYAS
jgi:two-component sensor histidine kinase